MQKPLSWVKSSTRANQSTYHLSLSYAWAAAELVLVCWYNMGAAGAALMVLSRSRSARAAAI